MAEQPIDSAKSRQIDFLEYLKGRFRRFAYLGVVVFAVGVLFVVLDLLNKAGVILGWVGIICGPAFVWNSLVWLRLLPEAREALDAPLINARLEVGIRKGYAAFRYTTAWLWPAESNYDSRPLAQFSVTFHWATPKFMTASKDLAQVHGAPLAGSAVFVSCPEGMLVGRIRWSRYGDDRPIRQVPAVLRWLVKPRGLRL